MNKFGESVSAGQVDPPSRKAADLENENMIEALEDARRITDILIKVLKEIDYYDSALKGGSHFIKLTPPKAGHVTNIYDELAYLNIYLRWLEEDLAES